MVKKEGPKKVVEATIEEFLDNDDNHVSTGERSYEDIAVTSQRTSPVYSP